VCFFFVENGSLTFLLGEGQALFLLLRSLRVGLKLPAPSWMPLSHFGNLGIDTCSSLH